MSSVQPQPPIGNPWPAPPLWIAPPPKGRGGGLVFATVGIVVAAVVGLLVVAYLAVGPRRVHARHRLGARAACRSSIVLLAVRWVDRWEPEPRWALWFAFLWGAAVSVAIALIVDLGVQLAIAFAEPGGSARRGHAGGGAGAVRRGDRQGRRRAARSTPSRDRTSTGRSTASCTRATVAAGFAFTENILYFGAALAEGGADELGATFVVRGIFSPFAHVLFTACTGIAIGIGARRGGGAGVMGWFLPRPPGAMLLHALWNGSLAFASDAIGLYFTVQVPIFVGAVLLTCFLRRRRCGSPAPGSPSTGRPGGSAPARCRCSRRRPAGGRRVRGPAQTPPRTAVMRKLITDATHLAFTRQRLVSGRAELRAAGRRGRAAAGGGRRPGGAAALIRERAVARPSHGRRLRSPSRGKSPNLVFESVADIPPLDVSKSSKALLEGFSLFAFNQGAARTCPSRSLIQRSIYDTFLDDAIERTGSWRTGQPTRHRERRVRRARVEPPAREDPQLHRHRQLGGPLNPHWR